MSDTSELRLTCMAIPQSARAVRHAIAAFLAVFDLDADFSDDVLTAVGEVLANAIEHAYDGRAPSDVEVRARVDAGDRLSVDVVDRGNFIEREPRPDRGFGIRIVRAIASDVRIETGAGTRIHMEFRLPAAPG